MLSAIVRQAFGLSGSCLRFYDALGRIRRVDELLSEWRERLVRASSRLPDKAIDLFAENPFWTVKKLAERLGVAFTSAQRAIDRLEAAELVTQTGPARRNRVYCAGAILEILDAPPQIAPGNRDSRRAHSRA